MLVELPYDKAISLLGILKANYEYNSKDTCTPYSLLHYSQIMQNMEAIYLASDLLICMYRHLQSISVCQALVMRWWR